MLSAYRNITSLSERMRDPSKLTTSSGEVIKFGDFDKRGAPSLQETVAMVADAGKDVADTIANALGVRSPYYVIGEVPADEDNQIKGVWSNYDKAAYGVYRAVSNVLNWNTKQRGIIIDSLGDMSSTMSVEFTSKPLFYLTSTAIDSRMRKPTILKSTIAVSNYMADDAIGWAANVAAAYDPTGALDLARDNLLYGGNTRAQYALYQLRWLMENGMPFTVYTPHGYYENMLIESLSPRTDANNMDMLLCDITYKEAILAAPYMSYDQLSQRTPTRTVVKPDSTISSVKTNFANLVG